MVKLDILQYPVDLFENQSFENARRFSYAIITVLFKSEK
jgi:hypothetical protein